MSVLGALGDLVLALSADTAKFQSDLGKADRIAKKFAKEVGSSLDALGKQIALLAGAGSLGALVKSQIDAADAAGKMAQKFGLSVESFSGLKYAAEISDVSVEQLGTGLRQLAKNMADTQAGTGEAREAFKALGISVVDSAGRLKNTDEQLLEIAESFAGMEDGAGKTALAMRIFGKSGAELIPFLNEGSAGIEKLRKEAERLGVVFSQDAAKAADEFNDNLKILRTTVEGLAVKIAGPLVESLNHAAKAMKDAETAGEGFFNQLIDGFRALFAGGDAHKWNVEFTKATEALLKAQREFDFATAAAKSENAQLFPEQAAQSVAKYTERLRQAQAEVDRLRKIKPFLAPGPGEDPFSNEQPAKPKKPAPTLPNEAEMERLKKLADELARIQAKSAPQPLDVRFDEMEKFWANQALDAKGAAEEIRRAEEAQKRYLELQRAMAPRSLDQDFDELEKFWARQAAGLDKVKEKTGEVNDFAKSLGLTFASAFEDAIIKGGSFRDVLKGIEQDIARIILRQGVTVPVANAIGAGLSGMFGGGGPEQLSGPPRAFGGPVSSGMPYMVGEHGPEVFVPSMSGSVMPNDSMGGVSIYQTINVDSRSDQASIAMAMSRAKDAAVAEVTARQQRRGDARIG
jgi:hypothetical protein